mgnify:CR=1 FL=1
MKLDSKDYAPPDPAKIDADNPEALHFFGAHPGTRIIAPFLVTPLRMAVGPALTRNLS